MKTIVLATNNQGKIREFKSLFQNCNILSLKDINYQDEIVEDGNSFTENAIIKAKAIAKKYNVITIADDSGLEVKALDGAPGIYSARYAGIGHDDKANNELLIKNLKGKKNRNARYVCAICLYYPNDQYITVLETCEGVIIDEPKGENGFGYDSHFYVEEYGKTFAEITLEEKNKISHRAKALRSLKEKCNEDFSVK